MSTYQFFIILHGLKDVLVWLVPLLIAILLCVTALVIFFRWVRERKARFDGVSPLAARLDQIESRLSALEHLTVDGSEEEKRAHGGTAASE